MAHAKAEAFDPETVEQLGCALDHAWNSLPVRRRAYTSRSQLARRIVRLASQGERDAKRLTAYAVIEVLPGGLT